MDTKNSKPPNTPGNPKIPEKLKTPEDVAVLGRGKEEATKHDPGARAERKSHSKVVKKYKNHQTSDTPEMPRLQTRKTDNVDIMKHEEIKKRMQAERINTQDEKKTKTPDNVKPAVNASEPLPDIMIAVKPSKSDPPRLVSKLPKHIPDILIDDASFSSEDSMPVLLDQSQEISYINSSILSLSPPILEVMQVLYTPPSPSPTRTPSPSCFPSSPPLSCFPSSHLSPFPSSPPSPSLFPSSPPSCFPSSLPSHSCLPSSPPSPSRFPSSPPSPSRFPSSPSRFPSSPPSPFPSFPPSPYTFTSFPPSPYRFYSSLLLLLILLIFLLLLLLLLVFLLLFLLLLFFPSSPPSPSPSPPSPPYPSAGPAKREQEDCLEDAGLVSGRGEGGGGEEGGGEEEEQVGQGQQGRPEGAEGGGGGVEPQAQEPGAEKED